MIRKLLEPEFVRSILLLCALLAVFFWNVVAGGSTFLTSTFTFLPNTMPDGPYGYAGHRVTTQPTRDAGASAFQTEPLNRLASRMFKTGQLPLWNPYAGLGVPLAANMQSGAFYPLSLLTYLAPDNLWVWVSDALTLLGFLTAGLFAYLFLRSIGVGSPGAVGSAAAYMFCGYLLYFLGTADWRVDVLIPLLAYGCERLYTRPSLGSGLLVAAGVMLSITAGMPEASLFSLLVAGLYYVYRALAGGLASQQKMREAAAALLPFAAASALGIALSAYLIIPFVEYLRLSWNSHPPGVGLASIPFDGAISLIVPNFFGNVLPSWYNPYPSDLWGTLPYIGGISALFALFAIARGAETNARACFWTGISTAFLLKAFGVPVVNSLGNLPLLDVSVFPRFAVAPFMFATAVLAGIGIDNLQQRRIGLVRGLATTAGVLAVIAGFMLCYWPRAEAAGKAGCVSTQVGTEAAFVLLACLAFLLARYRVVSARAAAVVLVGLIVVDLYAASPKDRSSRYDPFTAPPFVASLAQDHEPFRTLGLDFVLYPDTAGVYGIQDIKDLDGVYPHRLTTFLQRFVDPTFRDRFTGIYVLDNKYFDLLNVKYLVSKYPLMERWQSTDLTERIIQACPTPPGCPDFQVGRDGTDPALQVGGAAGRWSSTITLPAEIPESRVWLRFDIGATGGGQTPQGVSSPITFQVVFRDAKGDHMISSRAFDAAALSDWTWDGQAIDVTQFAGESGAFVLSAACVENCSPLRQGAWRRFELIEPTSERGADIGLSASAFVPVENDLASARNAVTWEYGDEVNIYRNDSAMPRAFVVHTAIWAQSGDDALDKLADPAFDPRREVVLEGAPPAVSGTDATGAPPAAETAVSTAVVTSQEPGRTVVQVSLDRPGYLVLANQTFPGWRATVDGKDANLLVADYLLQAVRLSPGNHRVEFIYDPWSFKVGVAISLAALVVVMIAVAVRFWRPEMRR